MKRREDGLIYFEDFSQEELRTLQLRLVGILEAFDAFCKEHHLRYYLSGGTLIGAIRHKAFIPWDDDLDLAMPREDYETLFRTWDNENNRFKVLRPTKDVLTGVHIGQIRDSETTCIYDYAKDWDICHGIKIDLEPIDGAPSSKLGQKIQRFYCLMFGLMSGQRIPNHGSKRRAQMAKIVLSIVRSKGLRYALFHFAEKQVSKYRIEDCDKVRVGFHLVFDKSDWGEPVLTEFEGKQYPVPAKYDKILRIAYGDYMVFPPEEERKPVTKVLHYDADVSYKEFKGIKYCVK